MTATIRLLTADDAADFRDMRLAALKAHPEAFGADYDEESKRSLTDHMDRLERDHFFGAFDDDKLVGLIGLILYDGAKMQHSGKIISMYVAPSHRGRKIGRALVETVCTAAKERVEQLYLCCVTTNENAKKLYDSCGFLTYGTEPRIMKIGDTYYDEYLMVRDLRA